MKYYIIAGEASGDLHGANLIASLKKKDTRAKIRAWGGNLMKKQGATLVKHYRDLAFMGFVEVLLHLRTILKNLSFCKKDILKFKPAAVILIDYPGFNMKIAKFAHKHNIKVYYYISPQVWAWKKRRVHTIKEVVDKMLVILPFEKDFYDGYRVDAHYVGHPLLDELSRVKYVNRNNFKLFVNLKFYFTIRLTSRFLTTILFTSLPFSSASFTFGSSDARRIASSSEMSAGIVILAFILPQT